MSSPEAHKRRSTSLIALLEGDGFINVGLYETGCSVWRNDVPHTFSYPEIETDPDKRAALRAHADSVADRPVASKRKKKPKQERHADD
ncbi:hypothetical protein [Hyphomicrobium sp.]|uniref:hypothetical protein n=1 Tax=Hyphomicrobium sp. TaxID=82 RepID=UPI001DB08882|nr:hypothetical protein [Hyphomicrobium sp.]MBY0561428.1 hypothetical protein [Hyphomicrobium sp.]